jgi:hypothetical protein
VVAAEEEGLVQLNVAVTPRVRDLVAGLAREYNLSNRRVVTNAVELLGEVMGLVEQSTVNAVDPEHPPTLAALYMRLAREAPGALVQMRPIEFTESDFGPVVHLDGWAITKDPESAELLIASQDGAHWGRIVGGEIRLVRRPTAAEVAAN